MVNTIIRWFVLQHWPGTLSMKSILLVGVLMALFFIGLLGMFVLQLNLRFLVLYIIYVIYG